LNVGVDTEDHDTTNEPSLTAVLNLETTTAAQQSRIAGKLHMIKRRVPGLLRTAAQWVPDWWLRIHAEGAENIPSAGPVLIAARHYHHLYDGLSAREPERMFLRGVRGAVQLLLEGSALVIFPEGYPNIDPHFTPKRTTDEFLPFHDGFTRIASLASQRLQAPIPIVPAGLRSHREPAPQVTVRFGRPLYDEKPKNRGEFVRRVEEEVMRLSR